MIEEHPWRDRAACKGLTSLFFSPHVCTPFCPPLTQKRKTCPHLDGRQTSNLTREQAAKMLCRECSVLDECRKWITENPLECKHGVVAGMSESERRRLHWKSTKKEPRDAAQEG